MARGVHPSHNCCLAFFPKQMLGVCSRLPGPGVSAPRGRIPRALHTPGHTGAPSLPAPHEPGCQSCCRPSPASVGAQLLQLLQPPFLRHPPPPECRRHPGDLLLLRFSILGVSGRQRRKHICELAVPWMFNQETRLQSNPAGLAGVGSHALTPPAHFRWGCASCSLPLPPGWRLQELPELDACLAAPPACPGTGSLRGPR